MEIELECTGHRSLRSVNAGWEDQTKRELHTSCLDAGFRGPQDRMTSEQGWQAGAATGVLSDPCKSQVSCSVPRGVRCCKPLQKELGFAGKKQEKTTQCGVRFWKNDLSGGCSCNLSARQTAWASTSLSAAAVLGRAALRFVGLSRWRLLGCGGPDCRFGGKDEAKVPCKQHAARSKPSGQ